MLSLAALSLSAAGFFASSATLSRTADAGRAGTSISLANAVTNGMLPGSKFCLNVKLCVRPERRDEFIACIRDNQKGTLSTEPLAVEYVWGEDVDQPNVVTPPFLDRVPMLLTASSRVYADDELFRLLRSRVPVDPFMVNEMHGLSDAYSYLGDEGGGDAVGIRHAYNFLGGQEEPLVSAQDSSHDRIVNYEKFVQERDNDLNSILKQK